MEKFYIIIGIITVKKMSKQEKKYFRQSKQRNRILELLRSTDRHPTADWLYLQLKSEFPNLSLGTVYRNLEILSESGEIQKLELGSAQKRFDGVAENHYHIRCIQCDRVDDAPPELEVKISQELKGDWQAPMSRIICARALLMKASGPSSAKTTP